MSIAIGTLVAVAIIWPKSIGRWAAEIVNAYEVARKKGEAQQ